MNKKMSKLKIAVTAGDPAGIGPEIIVKMFLKEDVYKYGDIAVIGDLLPLLNAQRKISKKIAVKPIKSMDEKQVLIVTLLIVAILFSVASIVITLGVEGDFKFLKPSLQGKMIYGNQQGNLHIKILPQGGEK